METVFLICFIFGALFTLVSAVLGAADVAIHLPHGGHDGGLGHGHDAGSHGGHDAGGHGHDFAQHLPVFNLSALLAFLTWFGAAGFLLLHVAGWPLLLALLAAILAGVAGAAIIARFLRAVLASERVMDPRDYALEGTIARVSVGIPPRGVGEIIFSLGGVRRSEAARSVTGRAIARDTEVVILGYERGVATVQPYRELTISGQSEGVEEPRPPALTDSDGARVKE